MTYQILPCPNCNGAGCPTCQNTGKVRVEEAELQKLKQMVGQLSQAAPAPHSPEQSRRGGVGPAPSVTNLAGIIAFSILSLIAGAAASSWYFLKTLKPFFSGLITLITLAAARFAWRQPFFQPQEPDDFLKATKDKA